MKMVEARDVKALAQNPRFARTDSDNVETAVPTMPQTRIHTSLPNKPMIKWVKIDELEARASGGREGPCERQCVLLTSHLIWLTMLNCFLFHLLTLGQGKSRC